MGHSHGFYPTAALILGDKIQLKAGSFWQNGSKKIPAQKEKNNSLRGNGTPYNFFLGYLGKCTQSPSVNRKMRAERTAMITKESLSVVCLNWCRRKPLNVPRII